MILRPEAEVITGAAAVETEEDAHCRTLETRCIEDLVIV